MIDFVAVDFETANRHHLSACAIGIADVRDGNLREVKSWRLCPPEGYSHIEAMQKRIHGLTESDIANAPTFKQLWPTISHYVAGRIVIAHSAEGVEITKLRELLKHFGIEAPEFRYACTLAVAKATWPEKMGYSLSSVAEHLGIALRHHDPEDDAKVCAMIMLAALKENGVDSIEELACKLRVDIKDFSMECPPSYSEVSGIDIEIALDSGAMHALDEMKSNPKTKFCTQAIKEHCSDEGAFNRGVKLFRDNKVLVTSKRGWEITGNVAGSSKDPYLVTVDGGLVGKCPCPAWINSSTRFCKHVVALALAWEAEGGPTLKSEIESMPADELKRILISKVEKHPELIHQLFSD